MVAITFGRKSFRTQCENYGNLLSHFSNTNFVKATYHHDFTIEVVKKLISRKKNFNESEILVFLHCARFRIVDDLIFPLLFLSIYMNIRVGNVIV